MKDNYFYNKQLNDMKAYNKPDHKMGIYSIVVAVIFFVAVIYWCSL